MQHQTWKSLTACQSAGEADAQALRAQQEARASNTAAGEGPHDWMRHFSLPRFTEPASVKDSSGTAPAAAAAAAAEVAATALPHIAAFEGMPPPLDARPLVRFAPCCWNW